MVAQLSEKLITLYYAKLGFYFNFFVTAAGRGKWQE